MKIKSIKIAAFGKLKDFSIDFTDGFNVVYGKNEAGKTTIMSFIKMMFYGTDKSSTQISKNLRKKYAPWSGERMAGSINFQECGKNFCLERTFGASNSSDKVYLTDLDMGEKQAVPSDVGTKIFGLSAPTFERTLFIGSAFFESGNPVAEGELNAKLSNLAKTGEESVSFEQVKANIEKPYFNFHSKSGKTGVYDKNLARLESLNASLNFATEEAKKSLLLKTKCQEKSQELSLISKELANIKTVISKENDIKNAGKLREFIEAKQKSDEQSRELLLESGATADGAFIGTAKFALKKCESAKLNLTSAQNNLETLKASDLDVEKLKSTATAEGKAELEKELLSAKQEKKALENEMGTENSSSANNYLPVVFEISGAALMLGGVLIDFVLNSLILGSSILGAGLVFFLIGILLKRSKSNSLNKLAETKSNIILAENKISQLEISLKAMNAALETNETIIANRKKALLNAQEAVEIANENYESSVKELVEYYGKYKKLKTVEEILNDISLLEEKIQEKKLFGNTLTILSRDLGGISFDEAQTKLKELSKDTVGLPENIEEIKKEYDALTEKANALYNEIALINAEIKSISKSEVDANALKSEKQALEKKVEDEEFFIKSAELAMEMLNESFYEVRRSFGGVLEEKTSEIFSGLTGGKYSKASVSKSFDISVQSADAFGSKETDYLSSGALSQAFLSLRIAVANLIAGEKPLPIFLDDPFVMYDDERQEYGNNYLKNYSENGQVLLFTCREEELNSAVKKGANTVRL